MTGYNDAINYNANLNYNGGSAPPPVIDVVTFGGGEYTTGPGPSAVRRLTMMELQNHPQVRYVRALESRKKEMNEEEELMTLLAGIMEEYLND